MTKASAGLATIACILAAAAHAGPCDPAEYLQYKDRIASDATGRQVVAQYCTATSLRELALRAGDARQTARCSAEIDKMYDALKAAGIVPDCIAVDPSRAAVAVCKAREPAELASMGRSQAGRDALAGEYCAAMRVALGPVSASPEESTHCLQVSMSILRAAMAQGWRVPAPATCPK
jgi:hypothetical protein